MLEWEEKKKDKHISVSPVTSPHLKKREKNFFFLQLIKKNHEQNKKRPKK